uniref:Uncharacterized protein n=1 Tax=Fagus sylvatica TaxID=28930 RepID=A0A2N9INC0_FAGSY
MPPATLNIDEGVEAEAAIVPGFIRGTEGEEYCLLGARERPRRKRMKKEHRRTRRLQHPRLSMHKL